MHVVVSMARNGGPLLTATRGGEGFKGQGLAWRFRAIIAQDLLAWARNVRPPTVRAEDSAHTPPRITVHAIFGLPPPPSCAASEAPSG